VYKLAVDRRFSAYAMEALICGKPINSEWPRWSISNWAGEPSRELVAAGFTAGAKLSADRITSTQQLLTSIASMPPPSADDPNNACDLNAISNPDNVAIAAEVRWVNWLTAGSFVSRL